MTEHQVLTREQGVSKSVSKTFPEKTASAPVPIKEMQKTEVDLNCVNHYESVGSNGAMTPGGINEVFLMGSDRSGGNSPKIGKIDKEEEKNKEEKGIVGNGTIAGSVTKPGRDGVLEMLAEFKPPNNGVLGKKTRQKTSSVAPRDVVIRIPPSLFSNPLEAVVRFHRRVHARRPEHAVIFARDVSEQDRRAALILFDQMLEKGRQNEPTLNAFYDWYIQRFVLDRPIASNVVFRYVVKRWAEFLPFAPNVYVPKELTASESKDPQAKAEELLAGFNRFTKRQPDLAGYLRRFGISIVVHHLRASGVDPIAAIRPVLEKQGKDANRVIYSVSETFDGTTLSGALDWRKAFEDIWSAAKYKPKYAIGNNAKTVEIFGTVYNRQQRGAA